MTSWEQMQWSKRETAGKPDIDGLGEEELGGEKKARAAVWAARKRPRRGRLRFLAVNAAKVGLFPPSTTTAL